MSTAEEVRRQQGRRLKAARLQLELNTAKEAAVFMKLDSDVTYQHHENGTRGMTRAVSEYAAKLGVAEEWLLYGRNPPDWAEGEDVPNERPHGDVPPHFLSEWRTHVRLTVEDLADKVGATIDMIGNWERGAEIPQKWLRKLADAIGTTQGAIIDADPGVIPASVLEVWLTSTKQQAVVRQQLQQIARTGTDN